MKIRIPREQLKVGMYIERAIIDKSDKKSTDVNFIQNVLIDSPKKLKELKSNNIKFLIIDTAKAQKIAPKKKPEPEPKPEPKEEPPVVVEEPIIEKVEEPEPEPEPEPEEEELLESFDDEPKEKKGGSVVSFEVELEKAREIKHAAVSNVKNMLQAAAIGKSFDAEPAKEQVNDMVKSVFRN